jgi:hypothetical protein
MDKLAPRFEVAPREITILKEPEEFYRNLKVRAVTPRNPPPPHFTPHPVSCATEKKSENKTKIRYWNEVVIETHSIHELFLSILDENSISEEKGLYRDIIHRQDGT